MIDMNNREQVIAKLAELKAKNLPKVNIESFRKVNKVFDAVIDKATDIEKKEIEEYLSSFYLELEGHCIFTDKSPFLDWSLIHGIMYDTNTGLSWRAYHYLTINGERRRFDTIMQYHPDNYSIAEEDDKE